MAKKKRIIRIINTIKNFKRVYITEENLRGKSSHFYAVIVPLNLKDGKLNKRKNICNCICSVDSLSLKGFKEMIPREFVQKHGKRFSDFAFLKLPNGAEWKVDITQCNGEVWLQNGWKEFAVYHSLAYGQLLVFRYEGPSQFQVLIFDMSAVEVEYSVNHSNRKGAKDGDREESIESDEDVEILNEVPKRRGEAPETFQYHKKLRTDDYDEDESEKTKSLSDLQDKFGGRMLREPKMEADYKHEGNNSKHVTVSEDQLNSNSMNIEHAKTISATATALERATAFKSRNPFFLTVMQPSTVTTAAYITVPYRFVNRYIDLRRKAGVVILRIPHQKDWNVKYTVKHGRTHRMMKLTVGRKQFIKENKLQVGDVCVFELVETKKLIFQVHIFRIPGNSHTMFDADTAKPDQVGKTMKVEIKTETHSFGEDECGVAELYDPVTFKDLNGSPPYARFESRKLKMNMQEKQSPGFQRSSSYWNSRAALAFAAASKFNSEHPFNIVSVRSLSSMRVRRGFFKGCGAQYGGMVILQVGTRSWPVKVLNYPQISVAWLSAGWSAFARENNLKPGDACVFEIIKKDDGVLKVTIFRCFHNEDT